MEHKTSEHAILTAVDPTGLHAVRVRQGMIEKSAAGGIVGPVPLGYRIEGYRDTARAEPDSDLAPLIREAFKQASGPGGSLRTVLAEMVKRGVTGRRGNPITLSTLQRMLHDPFYKGMVSCDGRLVRGRHEPLVSDDLFIRAQRQLRKR